MHTTEHSQPFLRQSQSGCSQSASQLRSQNKLRHHIITKAHALPRQPDASVIAYEKPFLQKPWQHRSVHRFCALSEAPFKLLFPHSLHHAKPEKHKLLHLILYRQRLLTAHLPCRFRGACAICLQIALHILCILIPDVRKQGGSPKSEARIPTPVQ